MRTRNNRIVYFYDKDVGNFFYGPNHPMKPHRIQMAHNLIVTYDLHHKMRVLSPQRATPADMMQFHTEEYINFLQMATPENILTQNGLYDKFNISEDCPIFDGLYEFCQISAGGSISAARELASGRADIAINWAGGLHHAKKAEASGFCYVADCVLGILELLERYDRVMYIDIDIHHGDGVEEAFYTTDRVLTVSFHKYGDFFPGTGHIDDIGVCKEIVERAEFFGTFPFRPRRVTAQDTESEMGCHVLDLASYVSHSYDADDRVVQFNGFPRCRPVKGGKDILHHASRIASCSVMHFNSVRSTIFRIYMVCPYRSRGYHPDRSAVEQGRIAQCACPDYQCVGIRYIGL